MSTVTHRYVELRTASGIALAIEKGLPVEYTAPIGKWTCINDIYEGWPRAHIEKGMASLLASGGRFRIAKLSVSQPEIYADRKAVPHVDEADKITDDSRSVVLWVLAILVVALVAFGPLLHEALRNAIG